MSAIQFIGSTVKKFSPFITVWKTDNTGASLSNQISLPLRPGGEFGFIVDWGDGTKNLIQSDGDTAKTHTYASPGTYTVTIKGILRGFNFATSGGEGGKLLEIKNWGCLQPIGSPSFFGCLNMDVTATDIPDFSRASVLNGFFRDCLSLVGNSSFNSWDVGHITAFGQGDNGMFRNCQLFNQDLSSWDVSNGQYFNSMFHDAVTFNQAVNNWDMSNATDIGEFARNATRFNQDISSWDISNVTLAIRLLIGATDYSTTNYSNALIAWSALPLQNDVHFSVSASYNSSASTARQYIIDTFNWTITDGGLI